MKTKCYSVKLSSLTSISDKAYKAVAFDGSEAILQKTQIFGQDYDVQKSDAYWIAAWILEKKELQYSTKKEGWFNPEKQRVEPSFHVHVETHVPTRIEPIESKVNESLIR
jgi:hypothetical protein